MKQNKTNKTIIEKGVVVFSMTVTGIDFALLSESSAVRGAFEVAVREAVASVVRGVRPEHVRLRLTDEKPHPNPN